MKIYTRVGDKGKTSLFGGTKVSKSSVRLHAYGTLDELNSCLGVAVAEPHLPHTTKGQLIEIQSLLFTVGADLATPLESAADIVRTDALYAEKLERWIDEMDTVLEPLTRFILPGGSKEGAALHQARTVCRRAERWIVQLSEEEPVSGGVIVVINRLGDYLFTAARYANKVLQSHEEVVVIPRKEKV